MDKESYFSRSFRKPVWKIKFRGNLLEKQLFICCKPVNMIQHNKFPIFFIYFSLINFVTYIYVIHFYIFCYSKIFTPRTLEMTLAPGLYYFKLCSRLYARYFKKKIQFF